MNSTPRPRRLAAARGLWPGELRWSELAALGWARLGLAGLCLAMLLVSGTTGWAAAFTPSSLLGATASGPVVQGQAGGAQSASAGPLPAAVEADVRSVGLHRVPGLSAARREARSAESAAALERLRAWWAGADTGATETVRDILLDGVQVSDERYAAWAGALAALEAHGFVDALATGLGDTRRPLRRSAARRALHDLLGPWFEVPEEVLPFARLEPQAMRAYAPTVHALQAERRTQALGHWNSRRAAALEALGDADPELIALAAGELAAAVGSGDLNAFDVAGALASALESEYDLDAACALVDALTTCVRGTLPEADWLADLRARLAPRLAQAPSRAALCWANLLAALPAAADDVDATERTQFAVEGVLALLEHSVSGPVDADVEIGLLQTLRSVVADLEPDARRKFDLFAPTRDRLVLPDVPSSVRAAAAAAWGDVAEVGQLPALWNLLDRELPEAEVLFPLLGSLSRLASDGEWAAQDRERLVLLCRRLIESGDVDLGRRAFELLEAPGVAEVVDDSLFTSLLTAFNQQTSVDLRLSILDWVGRAGSVADARALCTTAAFGHFLGQSGVRPARLDAALGDALERWQQPEFRVELASLLVSASAGAPEPLEPLALRWTAIADRSREVARLRASWGAAALATWIGGGRLDESLAGDLARLRSEDLAVLENWTFDEARLAMGLDVALDRDLDAWRAAAERAAEAVSRQDQRVALRWARIDHLRELGAAKESFQELRTAAAGLAWMEFRYRREFDEAEWRAVASRASQLSEQPDAARLGLDALLQVDRRSPDSFDFQLEGELWANLCESATDIAQLERARTAFARRAVGQHPAALELLGRIDAHLAALKSPQPAAEPETPVDQPSGENP